MKQYKTIDEYIKSLPNDGKGKVVEMRELLKKLVPKGEDAIRYCIPTVRLNDRNFLHYALLKNHFGFYPTPSGVKNFEKELKKMNLSFSKGCIRFDLDSPLPVALITKIVRYRVKEEKDRS